MRSSLNPIKEETNLSGSNPSLSETTHPNPVKEFVVPSIPTTLSMKALLANKMQASFPKLGDKVYLDLEDENDFEESDLPQPYDPSKDWSLYFHESIQIASDDSKDQFQVYKLNPTEPDGEVTVMCHHGAGHTGLSFALMAKELYELTEHKFTIISYDARGHGLTKCQDESDLSLTKLSSDLSSLIQTIIPSNQSIVLIGHSLGGCVVTEVGANSTFQNKLLGVVNIDVVEGTAKQALPMMGQFLSNQPNSFRTEKSGMQYCLKAKLIKNIESARLSIPAQLKPNPNLNDEMKWVWKTDLAASQPFWDGWFDKLSQKFLKLKTSKLLILAGTDRLDTELLVGQMQGKFQLEIRPSTSHVVMEDDPTGVADILATFITRNNNLNL